MSKLVFLEDKCKGCRYCEMACALKHEKAFNPKKARIRTKRQDLPERTSVTYCRHCPEPECLEACPVGALTKDTETGIVTVNINECTGCGQCVDACEYEAIYLHPGSGLAIKCDLCGGDPECVKSCPEGALKYEA